MENVNETNLNETNVNETKEDNKQSKQTKTKTKQPKQTKSKPEETELESKPEQTKTESKPVEQEIEDIFRDVFCEKGVYTPKTNAEIFSEMVEELTDSINSRRPEAAKKSSGLTLKSVASMAVVAIPVIAGVCYLKDRKKVNADTSSAFMNMGNGNF